jgi:hypothetical protein
MIEPYTDEQKEFLIKCGGELSTKELAKALNEKFQTNHSDGSVRTVAKKLGVRKSKNCRTRFCAESGEPLGSEKIIAGYKYIKVSKSNGGFYKDWKRESTIVWEQHNGEIPNGYMVVMLDGNKLNTNIENLCMISKKVAARMANGHGKSFWSEFPEVTRTAIEVCKLDEVIKSEVRK